MSEQSRPSEQEQSGERAHEAFKIDVETMQLIRDRQKAAVENAVNRLRTGAGGENNRAGRAAARQEVYGGFDTSVQEFLRRRGISEDDPQFDRQAAYIRRFSVDNMDDHNWYSDTQDEDGTIHISGRETVRVDYEADTNEAGEEVGHDNRPSASEVRDEAHAENERSDGENNNEEEDAAWNENERRNHEESRDDSEGKNADVEDGDGASDSTEEDTSRNETDRQAQEARSTERERLVGEVAKTRSAKHEAFVNRQNAPLFGKRKREAQAALEAAEQAYHEAYKAGMQHDVDDRIRNGVDVAELRNLIQQSINEHITGDADLQHQLLIDRGGKWGELMNKYDQLSTGKKVATGLGIAAVGVGLGVAAGGIGIAAGAVGAGMAVGRFGKGYALGMSKKYRRDAADRQFQLVTDERDLNSSAPEAVLQAGIAELARDSKDKIGATEKVKKRAFIGAFGAVAIGGAVGLGASLASDFVENRPQGWIAGKVGDTVLDDTPKVGASPSRETIDRPEFSSDALTIDRGEGWNQTFREMGIPQSEWNGLLNEVGPDLPDEVAYYDNNAGEWRITMTPDGRMPEEALNAIYDAWQGEGGEAADSGAASTDTNADTDTSTDTDSRTEQPAGDTNADTSNGASGSTEGASVSPEVMAANAGYDVSGNTITLTEAKSINEFATDINRYFGTNIAPAQVPSLLNEVSSSQMYNSTSTLPSGYSLKVDNPNVINYINTWVATR